MFRQWISAIVVVVVLASLARAFVGQEQGFNIGAVNMIQWAGGVGSAGGGHNVMFGHEQTAVGGWPSASGTQKETGVFTQVSSATGGPASVVQSAKAAGNQQHATGAWSTPTSSQGQQMGVEFSGAIVKPNGAGAVTATQSFVGGQVQTLLTPRTLSTASQVLGVTEYASVVGAPCSNPSVSNMIKVDLGQNQVVTAPYLPH
ncbi:MAG TPA: hypothetical protein VLI39_21135 [Sedimentisphaerales bacterium]|nr:hypothetical protein [Sedimentisphaerales bacterium]